jgi:integrase
LAERKRIGMRDVRALKPGETIWDAAVPGFGARRQRGDAVSFVLHYRTKAGRQRWATIGRFGAPWTPDTAREEARRLLGEVARGEDPAAQKRAVRTARTVAALCDEYLTVMRAGRVLTRRGEAKRPSTVANDAGRIERHIKPLIGHLPAATLTPADVEELMHDVAVGRTAATVHVRARGVARVRGGRATASRTVVTLGAIYAWAVRRKLVPENPCRGVQRFADGRRERRMSDAEYTALGSGLRRAAGILPSAVAATEFLALVGWRSGEAVRLRWSEVDLVRRLAVFDSKTGRTVRPLSHTACDLLRRQSRVYGNPLVFPSARGAAPMNFRSHWLRIAKVSGLPEDVAPHVLRHSFASAANDLGYSEATIGMLVGHRGAGVTRGYIHGADAVLLDAADRVAATIAERMGGAKTEAAVVPLRRG